VCTLQGERSLCTQNKGITGMRNSLENNQLHVREKFVYVELEVLKSDVAELNAILNAAMR
jgi:hypothetical protein